jgi:hypothetical protein
MSGVMYEYFMYSWSLMTGALNTEERERERERDGRLEVPGRLTAIVSTTAMRHQYWIQHE